MKIDLFGKEILNIQLKSFSMPSLGSMINELFNGSQGSKITEGNAYKRHVWVYACITAISRNVARVPIKFYSTGTDNEITSGPVPALFKRVNRRIW